MEDQCRTHTKTNHYIGATEPAYSFNVWELIMFPYTLLCKFCAPLLTVCNSQSACLLYWMSVQMLLAKCKHCTSCNSLFYPYYFYVFGQCIVLTVGVIIVLALFSKSVLQPFLEAYWTGLTQGPELKVVNVTRRSFGGDAMRLRKYCFVKRDLFAFSSADIFKGPSLDAIIVLFINFIVAVNEIFY